MPLFDRQYRLLVGQPSGPANSKKSPSVGDGREITDLRITFQITKTRAKNPNTNRVSIYNLAKSTRELLEKPGTRCVLYAGYREDSGPLLIFQGNVTFAWSRREDTEWVTQLELGDGANEIRDTMVSLGYSGGIGATTILQDIANQMGLPLSITEDAGSRQWQNGISFHGAARSALDRVTRGAGMEWSIQNGLLQVVKSGGTTNRQAIVISSRSGLIGYPDRERKGAQEVAEVQDKLTQKKKTLTTFTKQYDGWNVRSLLLPSVLPADRVVLDSDTVKGTMAVVEVRHTGDSHSGDFITDLKVTDLTTFTQLDKEVAAGIAKRNESRRKSAEKAAAKAKKAS